MGIQTHVLNKLNISKIVWCQYKMCKRNQLDMKVNASNHILIQTYTTHLFASYTFKYTMKPKLIVVRHDLMCVHKNKSSSN